MNKCEYCEGNKMFYEGRRLATKSDRYAGLDIWLENNELYVDGSADTYEPNYLEGKIKINYCPMCGKKLIVEEDNE